MPFVTIASSWVLQAVAQAAAQAASLPDTIVAKTLPAERGIFDYASGTLQIVVLLLAVVVLTAMALMLLATRRGLESLRQTVEKLYADTKPLVRQATLVAEDAREVVAMLRTDVVRVTDAASALTDQLLEAAETTEQRIDEVNAVLDVVQDELEHSAIAAAATLRGVRVGARELTSALAPGRRGRKRRRGAGPASPDRTGEPDEQGGPHAAD